MSLFRRKNDLNDGGIVGGESWIERQFKKVIEWNDNNKDVMFYRYDVSHSDIMNGTVLIVKEGQVALVSNDGIIDVFNPGRYELVTDNKPVTSSLKSITFKFENTHKQTVFFLPTKNYVGQKWGTKSPIMIADPKFEQVPIRAFGQFGFKVIDPKAFMLEISSSNKTYTVDSIKEQLTSYIIEKLPFVTESQGLPATEVSRNLFKISKEISELVSAEFEMFGLKITTLTVENINLPEEVQKYVNARTNINIMGGRANYDAVTTLDAMTTSAEKGGSSAFLNAGLGMGMGVGMARQVSNVVAGSGIGSAQSAQANEPFMKEKTAKPNGKFCSECGCKCEVSSKFCTECGTKFENIASNCECGAEISENQKFCTECGTKLK